MAVDNLSRYFSNMLKQTMQTMIKKGTLNKQVQVAYTMNWEEEDFNNLIYQKKSWDINVLWEVGEAIFKLDPEEYANMVNHYAPRIKEIEG